MVVDAFIRHYVMVLGRYHDGTGQEVLGTIIQALLELFYVNDGLVASPESARLHKVFDALMGLFNIVCLRSNERKTVSMACRPCHIPQTWSTEAYIRKVTGMKLPFWKKVFHRIQ